MANSNETENLEAELAKYKSRLHELESGRAIKIANALHEIKLKPTLSKIYLKRLAWNKKSYRLLA